jgi:hypothetical protein
MPVINGRYYMNPAMGAAIEEARSLLERNGRTAPTQSFSDRDRDDRDEEYSEGKTDDNAPSAVHRVEIECAEIGSARNRRKQHGYVAHVHRVWTTDPLGIQNQGDSAGNGESSNDAVPQHWTGAGTLPKGVFAPPSTAHVFADPDELIEFLRNVLAEGRR